MNPGDLCAFPKGRGSPQPAGMDHRHGIPLVLFMRCFQLLSIQICKNWESPEMADSISVTKLPKQNRSWVAPLTTSSWKEGLFLVGGAHPWWRTNGNWVAMGAMIKDNNHPGTVLKARPGTGSQLRALKGSGDSQQGWKCSASEDGRVEGGFVDKREMPRAMRASTQSPFLLLKLESVQK